jgi:hypothetical protein
MNQFTVTTPITASMIADQVIAGFEGGITYWAAKARPVVPAEDSFEHEDGNPWYARPTLYENDFKIRIVQHEEHTAGAGTDVFMTPDSVQRGLDLMATKYPDHFSDLVTENGDATTADVFIQCCALGELIYG